MKTSWGEIIDIGAFLGFYAKPHQTEAIFRPYGAQLVHFCANRSKSGQGAHGLA
jgi:hypothetical protein